MLGLGYGKHLARSCNNESDWLIPGENTYPMIPGDGVKRTIPRVREYLVWGRDAYRSFLCLFCVP